MKMTKKQWEIVQLERKASAIKEVCLDKNIFDDIIPMIFQMQKYERQLHRLDELDCNGYPKKTVEYRDGKTFIYDIEDVALRERSEKRYEKIQEKVTALAKSFNLTVEFQSDPRGMAFQLVLSDNKTVSVA